MKITLFTANQSRHNYLINLLSNMCSELFVIQESRTIFPGIVPGPFRVTETMKEYFLNVSRAQKNIFGNPFINGEKKNLKILPLGTEDLKKCSMNILKDFLKSDIYIVFGSSYIKGELVKFLIKHKTINIHMGVSPYYRGTDCNFWALFDGNSHLVGSTIHFLSEELDGGPILYHALSEKKSDPFLYTMSTVKSAFHSLANRIKDQSIFKIKNKSQDKSKEIRYSKKIEFTDDVVNQFFTKKIDLSRKFDKSMLKDPYFLKNDL